ESLSRGRPRRLLGDPGASLDVVAFAGGRLVTTKSWACAPWPSSLYASRSGLTDVTSAEPTAAAQDGLQVTELHANAGLSSSPRACSTTAIRPESSNRRGSSRPPVPHAAADSARTMPRMT